MRDNSMDTPPRNRSKQEIEKFLRLGIDMETAIEQSGMEIRERAKTAYKDEWLYARMHLVAVLSYLQTFRSGIPGKSNSSISERLILTATFLQGVNWVERLITEAQYTKAAAALKQDYEILTRIIEVKKEYSKPGKVPNIRHAPKGSQRLYGELNDVAHPSNPDLLQGLLSQLHEEEVHGVSAIPVFNQHVVCSLYEFHVWLILGIACESIFLAWEMYGEDNHEIFIALQHYVAAKQLLVKAGMVFENSN